MKTLISESLIHQLNTQFPPPNFLFHFPSLSRKNPQFLDYPHRKWLCYTKALTFCSATASDSPNYGGWDNPRLGKDSFQFGESNQLLNRLSSLGIDDRKYVFMYLLGFVCALTISRVRVSSIVVLPVCVLLFGVGFSIGFVNGGQINDSSLIGTKKKPKNENLRVLVEKLRNLGDFFKKLDGKVSNLKNDIERGIECNQITVSDLKNYVKVMDLISLSVLNAGSVVEACIDSMLAENQEVEPTLNQKSSRRKKELGETGHDLFQFIGSLCKENPVCSKPNKMKDSVKKDSMHLEVNDQNLGNVLAQAVEKKVLDSLSSGNVKNGSAGLSGSSNNKPHIGWNGAENMVDETRRINVLAENDKIYFAEIDGSAERVFESKEFSYRNNKTRFMNNHQISLKMGHHNEVKRWASHENLLDSMDFSASMRMRNEESFEQEQRLEMSNGNGRPYDRRKKSEKEIYRSPIREEERTTHDGGSSLADHHSTHEGEFGASPSSSVSDDLVFNRYLVEANILLKQARECLRHRGDQGHAETVLNKSAKLLSSAIDMKPMSLLAVGLLGNTYLLHGELKLKISRELRAILANSDPLSVEKWGRIPLKQDEQEMSKDKIASALVNVCEECEELLVAAGRKYRLALSIDGNDMRALYNWGLALSFRAQLIAEIGPEAAFDADKVFLAAIDKFDAMMSKSNVYAPDGGAWHYNKDLTYGQEKIKRR
ncbi:uncharacterized protein LOC132305852 isoform X2 [Cornus florida]|uniref:uncharacterized protein LOC132305852 isoform X2 n=1 Tax=Cornus florida TaxID=4283 RepID=UPI002899568D|nr:uncharacterized protein LOC132305852 isoform X2 [Cornus florida]